MEPEIYKAGVLGETTVLKASWSTYVQNIPCIYSERRTKLLNIPGTTVPRNDDDQFAL